MLHNTVAVRTLIFLILHNYRSKKHWAVRRKMEGDYLEKLLSKR